MGTTPRVWLSHDRKKVIIGERTFDGIDTDYSAKHQPLTPDEARYVAQECWKYAEQIDGKKKKKSVLKEIRKNTDKIIKEAKKAAGI